MGMHLVQGLCGLAKRYGEFPTGYTMGAILDRFQTEFRLIFWLIFE